MIYFGLDLGQASDYTALTAVEKVLTYEKETQFHTRHAERFELGMPYPMMIDKLDERINALNIRDDYMTVADATGVGRPVIDLMRDRKIKVVPVTITGGDKELFDPEIGGWRVPKRILASTMQVLLQNGQLKFAKGLMHAQTLIDELLNFKVKVNSKAHDQYEAWREGDHDDLVLSLAMAVWYAERYGVISNKRRKATTNPWMEIESI